jgi:methylmalonyl-CoA mutase C-terminal domain/subunit
MRRKIRVLVGKPGLDGHDRGAKVVAAALRDAGMEVIYTGLHQTAAQVVEAAVQEDVDVVALSILSGAHMTLFPEVLGLMRERGIADRLLTGGGIIPPEDMESLAKSGVGRLFGPGASTQDIARYIREWFVGRHGEGSLAAPPAPRAAATSAPASANARAAGKTTPAATPPAPARAAARRAPADANARSAARSAPAAGRGARAAARPARAKSRASATRRRGAVPAASSSRAPAKRARGRAAGAGSGAARKRR